MEIRIELLSGHHDRKAFDCGEQSLNDWLARMALQQQRKNYARTRVAIDTSAPKRILGYSALVAHEIDTRNFPSDRSLPKRLPCVLLGRLAVDSGAQGLGIGRVLLLDAIERTRTAVEAAAGVGPRPRRSTKLQPASIVVTDSNRSATEPLRLFLAVTWPP